MDLMKNIKHGNRLNRS